MYSLFAFKFVLLYKSKSLSRNVEMMNKEEAKGKKLIITLKTVFGLEEVLVEELAELGYKDSKILNRAVQIKGTWNDVYYLNVHLRCAISVLVQIETFRIRNEDDLYKQSMKIDWTKYFTLDKTFAVKGAVFSDLFSHTQYPFLVVKDAIADTFRKKHNDRPDVNIKRPAILFDVYINRNDVTVSLNTSGAPLFQRGYRQAAGLAPMNEVVAAGLLRLTGWDKKSTIVDPFCGSGTLLIEAALMAAGIPSSIERQHYAFKNFANFDEEAWNKIQDDINDRVRELPCVIKGSDISAEMVTKARRNLSGLSVGRFVETIVDDFADIKKPTPTGIVITNPPYGERMGEEIEEMYEDLGNWMKTEMKGYDCWIISSNLEAFKFVGLRPDRKIKVYNGSLECSFRKYSIYEGSKKTKFQNQEGDQVQDLDNDQNQDLDKEQEETNS